MSIATLKRKSAVQYNNMSVGEKTFSLNGTHRSQGYVGQSTQSRFLSRTLMKGDTIKGHGGCCGKYPVLPVVSSSVSSTENSTVLKSSVLDTHGMMATKYRWITRPQPFATVKPDSNQNNNHQGAYLKHVNQTTLKNVSACTGIKKPISAAACRPCDLVQTDMTLRNISNLNIVQPIEDIVAMSQSDYLLKLDKKCGVNDTFQVQTPIKRTPFSCH